MNKIDELKLLKAIFPEKLSKKENAILNLKLTQNHLDELVSVIDGDVEFYDTAVYEHLYEHYLNSGEMPYGVAKARTGDPDMWIWEQLEKEGII